MADFFDDFEVPVGEPDTESYDQPGQFGGTYAFNEVPDKWGSSGNHQSSRGDYAQVDVPYQGGGGFIASIQSQPVRLEERGEVIEEDFFNDFDQSPISNSQSHQNQSSFTHQPVGYRPGRLANQDSFFSDNGDTPANHPIIDVISQKRSPYERKYEPAGFIDTIKTPQAVPRHVEGDIGPYLFPSDVPFCRASFSFGGNLVLIASRRIQRLNPFQSTPVDQGPLRSGPVTIMPAIRLAKGNIRFLKLLSTFPSVSAHISRDKSLDTFISFIDSSTTGDARTLWSLLFLLFRLQTTQKDVESSSFVQQIIEVLLDNSDGADDVRLSCENSLFDSQYTDNELEQRDSLVVIAEIQRLVISGKLSAACHTAIEYGMWDHALLLAENEAKFREIVSKFAGRLQGTPLGTFYSHVGGLGPSESRHWRADLSSVLSRCQSTIDPKTVKWLIECSHLLRAQRLFFASSLCQVLAGVEPGTDGMWLLGSEVHPGFQSSHSILNIVENYQMTEFLHRILQLGQKDVRYIIPYQLLYAMTLIDWGYLEEAGSIIESVLKETYKKQRSFAVLTKRQVQVDRNRPVDGLPFAVSMMLDPIDWETIHVVASSLISRLMVKVGHAKSKEVFGKKVSLFDGIGSIASKGIGWIFGSEPVESPPPPVKQPPPTMAFEPTRHQSPKPPLNPQNLTPVRPNHAASRSVNEVSESDVSFSSDHSGDAIPRRSSLTSLSGRVGSKIRGLFGGAKEVDLGGDSTYSYDSAKGRWIRPGEQDIPEPQIAPPPMAPVSVSTPPPMRPSGFSSTTPTQRYKSRSSLSSRYVNSMSSSSSSIASDQASVFSPGISGQNTRKAANVFVPKTSSIPMTQDQPKESIPIWMMSSSDTIYKPPPKEEDD